MAIQVSGTTVINDSRQLQNIASLDSTTSSTIAAAAGGGGLTELLVDNQALATNTYAVDIDIGSIASDYYDRYIISLTDIRPTTDYVYPRMRVKNLYGFIVGTPSNYYSYGLHNVNDQHTRTLNSYVALQYNQNASGNRFNMILDLWYPYSSTRKTIGYWKSITGVSSSYPIEVTNGAFMANNGTGIDQNRGVYIYFSSGAMLGNYSVWGQNK